MCEAKNDSIKRKVKNAEIHAYDGLKKKSKFLKILKTSIGSPINKAPSVLHL